MSLSKVSRVFSIITSALVGIMGILLIISTLHMYFTNPDAPFTRERVGEYLGRLIIPGALTLVSLITGLIIDKSVPRDAREDATVKYERLLSRVNVAALPRETALAVEKEKKEHRIIALTAHGISFVLVMLATLFLIFLAEFSVENLNDDVLRAFLYTLPLSCVAVAVHIPKRVLYNRSASRAHNAVNSAVKGGLKLRPLKALKESVGEVYAVNILRWVILGVAVVFVIVGIFNGGMSDVLAKAVKICTECIGLG